MIIIIIMTIIIINIYIALTLFTAKRFTMLQKGLEKKIKILKSFTYIYT